MNFIDNLVRHTSTWGGALASARIAMPPFLIAKGVGALANIVEIGSGWVEPKPTVGELAVGSIISLNENNAPTDYIIVHQGLPGSMYDSSCNGTWVLRKDIYSRGVWDASNMNTYNLSTINNTLNNLISLYDENVQDNIVAVKIPYCVRGGSGEIRSGANGLSCKIFLLSGREVGFSQSVDQNFPNDGVKLAYFESGTGGTADNKRIAKLNGSNIAWWLRSPSLAGNTHAWFVNPDGNCGNNYCAGVNGIRPAFILNPNYSVSA